MHIDPHKPCPFPAGSVRKMLWMRKRALAGLPLFDRGDCIDIEDPKPDANNHVNAFHANRRKETVIALIQSGHRQRDVARLLRISHQRVHQILVAAGLAKANRRRPERFPCGV